MTDDQKNDMPTPEEAAASGLPLEEAEERGTEPAPEAAPSEEGTPTQRRAPRPLPRRLRKRSSLPRPNRQRPLFPMCQEATTSPRQEAPPHEAQPARCRPPSRGIMGPMARRAMDTACLPSSWGQPAYPQGMWQQAPGPERAGAVPPQGPPPGGQPPMGGIPCLPRAQPSPPPSRPGRKWAWG